MKAYIPLLLLLCLTSRVSAQNLINNPSFELKNACPLSVSDIKAPFQEPTVIGWYNVSQATSDYYNACNKIPWTVGVPENIIGWQHARTGDAYAGFYARNIYPGLGEYREYLQTQLQVPLVKDHVYAVSFWVSLSEKANTFTETGVLDFVDDLGAYFSGDYLTGGTSYGNAIELQPQVIHKGEPLSDTTQWMQVKGTFTAAGDEQWMVIGRFSAAATQPYLKAYYYIDDVCVSDVTDVTNAYDTILCRQVGDPTLGGRDFADQYLWNTGDTSKLIPIKQSGTYWVRSSKECVYSIDTFHTTLDTHKLDLGDDISTCVPFTMLLHVDSSFKDYLWSTGDSTYQTTVSELGTYAVSAKSGFCILTDTINITKRIHHLKLLGNDTLVCGGTSVQIRAEGEQGQDYSWAPSSGVSDSTILEPVIFIEESTFYTLTASYPNCPDTSVGITIAVQARPEIVLKQRDTVCEGANVVLEPVIVPYRDDYRYTWELAGSQISQKPNIYFKADTSAVYTLTVESPAGCIDTEIVQIMVIPQGFGRAISDTGYCPQGSVELWAAGGKSYQWMPVHGLNDPQVPNPIANPETSTHYEVYIRNEHDCLDTQVVSVQVYPAAVMLLPKSITIYPGEQHQIEPETNALYFDWFPSSGISDVKTANPVLNPKVRTRYFVTASTEHGCVASDSLDVLVSETIIDMPNAFVPGEGFNNEFKVSKRGIAKLNEFSIFNRWGNKIFTTSDIDKGWDGTCNNMPQPLGTYIYIINAVTNEGRIFKQQGNLTLLR